MPEKTNIEEVFNELFKGGTTSTGEEEILKTASKYSMQLSAGQIKLLLYINDCAYRIGIETKDGERLMKFIKMWLEWKQYNNSASFIDRIMSHLSLKRFIGENAFRVDIKK